MVTRAQRGVSGSRRQWYSVIASSITSLPARVAKRRTVSQKRESLKWLAEFGIGLLIARMASLSATDTGRGSGRTGRSTLDDALRGASRSARDPRRHSAPAGRER